jgi:AraC-like DNA-binding protein
MALSRGLSLKSVAAQAGLFPAARLSDAFERRFGVAPRLFREMHSCEHHQRPGFPISMRPEIRDEIGAGHLLGAQTDCNSAS